MQQHLNIAEQAGQGAPTNENPHGTPHAVGIVTNQTQEADSKHPGAAVQQGHAKAMATMVAKCALAGITLIETTGDNGRSVLVASRGALTKAFDSLQEVESWLSRAAATKQEASA